MGRDNLDDSLMGVNVNNLESDDPHRFQMARNGDHIMLPFQCDLCHFMQLQRRVPLEPIHQDWLLILAIYRVNLDNFWSRESLRC